MRSASGGADGQSGQLRVQGQHQGAPGPQVAGPAAAPEGGGGGGRHTPSGGRDVQMVSWGEPAGRERVSRSGRGALRKTGLLPEETATTRHRVTDREGDKMQSGKSRGEQGKTERHTETGRDQRVITAETENV